MKSDLPDRTFRFAVEIVKLFGYWMKSRGCEDVGESVITVGYFDWSEC
jgi:hypothetical protein